MGVRRAKAAASTHSTTARPKTQAKRTTAEGAAKRKLTKPTLSSVATQLEALSEQVAELIVLVRAARPASPKKKRAATAPRADRAARGAANRAGSQVSPEEFDSDLVALLADLDRRGRHSGLVPIPDLRDAFVDRGWTRASFDERLLQAERDFLVDLKAANDPARLAKPELAIQQPGRGHLQYVVAR